MEYSDKVKKQFNDRLKKVLAKKFDTTMIYPLSQFEAAFGHLWKQGVDKSKLTEEELILRNKWEECRNNILNVGNHQKRNANAELDMHEVIWKRYQTVFTPVNTIKG